MAKGLVQVCVLPNRSPARPDNALAELVDAAERLRREATGVPRGPGIAPRWFETTAGELGSITLEGMKRALDPHKILNPGLPV